MDYWDAANDTLGAIAWPAIAGLFLILFRDNIGSLIERIRSLRAGPAELSAYERAELTANATAEANEDLADLSSPGEDEGLERPAKEHEAATPGEPAIDATDDLPQEPQLEDLREQVNDIVTVSARAGYKIAAAGMFKTVPRPLIKWEDGRPRIESWEGTDEPAPPHLTPPRTEAKTTTKTTFAPRQRTVAGMLSQLGVGPSRDRLEEEIRNEINRLGPAAEYVDTPLVAQLRKQLKEIDPSSPYAYRPR